MEDYWLRDNRVPNGNLNIIFKTQKQILDSFLGFCIYNVDKQKAAQLWTQLFCRGTHSQIFPFAEICLRSEVLAQTFHLHINILKTPRGLREK